MATIIKRDRSEAEPSGHAVRAVPLNFSDLAGRADEYLEQVRREAAKIVQQAHREAQQIHQRAEQAGRTAAEQAIERILDEKTGKAIAQLRPTIESIARQLQDARGEWLEHWQKSAVRLSVRMAEMMTRRQLDAHPEIPLRLIREALELAAGSAELRLRMHPQDLQLLRGQVDQLLGELRSVGDLQVIADDSVTRGGCVVTTKFGEIDLTFDAQIRRLEQELS